MPHSRGGQTASPPSPTQLWEELELQASKDDEAAAKWLELVSSCGFLFPPNKASIFSLRVPSAPHLHYSGSGERGAHKMNLRIFGILFYSCCGRGGKGGGVRAAWVAACGWL